MASKNTDSTDSTDSPEETPAGADGPEAAGSTLVAADSDEGVVGPDLDEVDVPAAWTDVPGLADVGAADRDKVADRLANAWISDNSDDAALLGEVIAEVGFGGLLVLLRNHRGDAGKLAAVLDTSAMLRDADRLVLDATKMSAKALVRAADRIDELTLDGDLAKACAECTAILVKMRSNLDNSRTSNPLAKLLRPNTTGLRYVVGDLLAQVSRRR